MKGIRDYLRDGYEIKTSHVDMHGSHWMIMQNGPSMVMVKLPMSMWTGSPATNKEEECWEIKA